MFTEVFEKISMMLHHRKPGPHTAFIGGVPIGIAAPAILGAIGATTIGAGAGLYHLGKKIHAKQEGHRKSANKYVNQKHFGGKAQ